MTVSDDEEIGSPLWWGVLACLVGAILVGLVISGSQLPAVYNATNLPTTVRAHPCSKNC
jgi:hypothetical protein